MAAPVWLVSLGSSLVGWAKDAWTQRAEDKARDRAHKNAMKEEDQRAALELRKAKNVARIERTKSADEAAGALDAVTVAARGFKDEILMALTMSPVVLLFVSPFVDLVKADTEYQPGQLQAAVMAGFTALNAVPAWYAALVLVIFIDTYGLRRLLRTAIESFAQNVADGFARRRAPQ